MIPRVISATILFFQHFFSMVLHQFWYQSKGAIMATRSGRSFRGSTLSECTWITDNLFQQLNQDLYERFHAFNSPGSSFSKPRVVDGDK